MFRINKILVLGFALCLVVPAGSAQAALCGDVDGDGQLNISDVVYLVDFMFQGGAPLPDLNAVDCNGDKVIDISDLICWVDYHFLGAPAPVCDFPDLLMHLEESSGCISDSASRKELRPEMATSSGYLVVEVSGYDIHLFHFGAYYQCCLGYYVEYNQEGSHIVGHEIDTGYECDCICPFNLKSTIYNLQAGEYTVTLIGIEGDTVGSETVTLPGEGPVVIEYGDSGCLETFGGGSRADVEYVYSGDTLVMFHNDGYFNCGGKIAVLFDLAGDTLRFTEINVSDVWMYCMCYFAVYGIVVGVPPGGYVAEIYARDYPLDPTELIDRRTITLGE